MLGEPGSASAPLPPAPGFAGRFGVRQGPQSRQPGWAVLSPREPCPGPKRVPHPCHGPSQP